MKKKNKISVIVIAGNEESNIEDCLESVAWADEIVVVDSASADRTVEIAKRHTPNVHVRAWQGYANQKAFALNAATNEWVLSLDADERVQPKLAEEIAAVDLGAFDGYRIKRENYFLGKRIRGCGWGRDYQLRLFRKSRTTVTDRQVHEGFKVDGDRGGIGRRHHPLFVSHVEGGVREDRNVFDSRSGREGRSNERESAHDALRGAVGVSCIISSFAGVL